MTETAHDWENPQLLQRNRERAHATLLPYPDEATPRAMSRAHRRFIAC